MPTVRCDSRGRITIPKEIREKFGRKFYLVETHGDIVLIPVSENPIKALAEMGRKAGLDKLSIREIKEAARKQAEEEIYASLCKD